MLDFITRFFKREEASKTLAKERLRLVLMSDRVSLAPDVFDEMKGEMLSVIRRYLEIDERALDMHFENLERQFALLASIPVLKVRSAEEIRASLPVAAAIHVAQAVSNGATTNGTVHDETPRSTPSRRRRRRRRSTGTISTNGSATHQPEEDPQQPLDPQGPDAAP